MVKPWTNKVATPRRDRFVVKALCVWWDMKDILYFELLEPQQTVDAQCYSHQLRRLNEKILENRTGPVHGKREVMLFHYNARPHVAKETQKTIINLGLEVMPHSAYSPDLAPSDYYPFSRAFDER